MNAVEQALKESRERQDVRRFMRVYAENAKRRARAQSEHVDHKTQTCPACGQGLKWKTGTMDSLAVCMGCGFVRVFRDVQFDHGTQIGEAYLPGVTGKARGFVAARVRNGKVVGVER